MTTAKTASKRVRRNVDESVCDPENGQNWAFKAPTRPKGWKSTGAVSLARVEAFEPSGGWHRAMRALWNMGEAAETATTLDKETGNEIPSVSGRNYYGKRRDAILANVVAFIG